MSADGDTVRAKLNMLQQLGVNVDAEIAALARLEAAETELAEYTTDVGYAAGYQDGRKYAEAQRDALAKLIADWLPDMDDDMQQAFRAALAEAGLEEEPSLGDPRPDPRTHPEFWNE